MSPKSAASMDRYSRRSVAVTRGQSCGMGVCKICSVMVNRPAAPYRSKRAGREVVQPPDLYLVAMERAFIDYSMRWHTGAAEQGGGNGSCNEWT
jgi:hypothetical protein